MSSLANMSIPSVRYKLERRRIENSENKNGMHTIHKIDQTRSMEGVQSESQPTSQQENLAGPRTPGRISFSDLIANPEDALSRPITATPVDQVEWRAGPGSSDPAASKNSDRRRNGKRARSSSPTSHSQTEKSRQFVIDKDPLDLEVIGRSLRTPKHEDPLSLLWANYAGGRGSEDQNEPVLPPMSSSPNTPVVSKKDNFRRTASCGIAWPTSSTKKRKLHERDPYGRAKGIFAAHKDAILAKNATNQSRVGVLVDSIHQSLLSKAATGNGVPSSSSPLPDRYAEHQQSPIKALCCLQVIPEQNEETIMKPMTKEKTREGSQSSEYGESDIDPDDPDLLDALQAATQKPVLSAQTEDYHGGEPTSRKSVTIFDATYAQADFEELESDVPITHESFPKNESLKTPATSGYKLHSCGGKAKNVDGFDVFEDDDDDDDFATELATLAQKVDSQDVTNLDGVRECDLLPIDLKRREVILIDDFDEGFDEDDDTDEVWTAIGDTVTSRSGRQTDPNNEKAHNNRAIKRYLILDVLEAKFRNVQGRQQPEKILSIKDEKVRQIHMVHLRQSWYDTRCTAGSYIHLIGDFDQYGNCIVDDNDNMIILHPDHLISATTVADSFSCTRRATLQDRVKATSPAEPPQVYGHLIHELFGEVLRQNQWDTTSIRKILEKLIPNYIESLYEINASISDATEYVMSKMPELTAWASIFVTGELDAEATIRDRNGAVVPMAIDKLLELEEHIWSPIYGLKGNIDATVQVQMQLPGDKKPLTLTVPFELKTGKRDSNEMHRAQTALYTLLLSDRYDINVTSGILYYLETSKTFRVEGIRNEIRHMVIQRNELACYVHDKLDLPPMVRREHLCKKCFAQTACFTYHKLVENGDGETSGMKDIFNDAVRHLNEKQQVFFKKWDDLLTKEERDAMKFKRELWTMLSHERQALGRCFSEVMIEPGSAIENNETAKINRYSYSFVKHKPKPGFSFTDSQITIGEPIVVSDEDGHFALAIGFVTSVRPTRVTVAVDRRLQNVRSKQAGFDSVRNQVFSAIMEVKHNQSNIVPDPTDPSTPKLYRIDKDEFATGMATARNNVLRIMEKDLWRARELRQLIVDLKAPVFKQVSTSYALSGPASQQDLNIDQREAIEKVMSAKDYALVLGMPGTGKTTTIAHIIRALVSQNKSVLLTSYTHTAVDNILLKIKDDGIPILRLGAVGKVHPDVARFADLSGVPKHTIAELERSWTKSKVVATTCLGINHPLFNHRKFDYCIVDEASQITLPVCLGPIRLASTFILVGDHYQLPPLVQNKEAQEGGLDISLFKSLSDAQPSSVVNLEHQYRMAEDIMLLSNKLIYNGRLKCGTPSVATRMLEIPNVAAGLEAHHHPSGTMLMSPHAAADSACILNARSCWLSNAIDPRRRTLFLNTDTISGTSSLGAPETATGHGTRITNQIEAVIVAQLLTVLIRSGVSPKNIGVITFYRSQLAMLRSTVKSLAGTAAISDLEMHTADKYQGRDKEVILLSCVRSNEHRHIGELLKDWRRVNVALTRARSKLVIVGSLSTLGGSGVAVLEGLVEILREKKSWVLDLPRHVVELHRFEGWATQTQTQAPVLIQQQRQRQQVKLGHDSNSHDHNHTARATVAAAHPVMQRQQRDRIPLAHISGNIKPSAATMEILPQSHDNGPKKESTTRRKPDKIVHGNAVTVGSSSSGVKVDRFLDRHPLIKDFMDD